jgi:hypothetical protein
MEFGEKDFDRRLTFTFWGVVGTLLLLGLVAAPFYGAWTCIDSRMPIAVFALSAAGLAVGLAILYLAWFSSLNLKVELSDSPREARCWRKNRITRRTSYRCYKLGDDAKVIVQPRRGGGRGYQPYYWPIVITGLPWYYDFWSLAGCKSLEDAASLSRSMAVYLGLRLFDGKVEVPTEGPGIRPWTGPRPEHPGHHDRRRRRKR